MTMMLLRRPIRDAESLPTPMWPVIRRMEALAVAIDGAIDIAPEARDPLFVGCLVLSQADLLIAGTSCRRPLVFAKTERLAQYSGRDLVLLRYDPDRGTTFDLYLQIRADWLVRYQGLAAGRRSLAGPRRRPRPVRSRRHVRARARGCRAIP